MLHHLEVEVDPSGDRAASVYLPSGFADGMGSSRPDVTVSGAEVSGWDASRRVLELTVEADATSVSVEGAA